MEYSVKRIKFRDGRQLFIPLVRSRNEGLLGKLLSRLDPDNDWKRIVKIYNKYILMDIFDESEDFGLTEEDCKEHIEAYRKQLLEKSNDEVVEMQLIDI